MCVYSVRVLEHSAGSTSHQIVYTWPFSIILIITSELYQIYFLKYGIEFDNQISSTCFLIRNLNYKK